jgi:Tfp pilus assembly protein PilO
MNQSKKELLEKIRGFVRKAVVQMQLLATRLRPLALMAWSDIKADWRIMSRIMFGVLAGAILAALFVAVFVDQKVLMAKKTQAEQTLVQKDQVLLKKADAESLKQQAQIKSLTEQVASLTQEQTVLEKEIGGETDIRVAGADIRLHKNSGVSVVIVAPQQNDNLLQSEVK